MAFVAIAELPYGYCTLTRLVVCATAIYVIVDGIGDGIGDSGAVEKGSCRVQTATRTEWCQRK